MQIIRTKGITPTPLKCELNPSFGEVIFTLISKLTPNESNTIPWSGDTLLRFFSLSEVPNYILFKMIFHLKPPLRDSNNRHCSYSPKCEISPLSTLIIGTISN